MKSFKKKALTVHDDAAMKTDECSRSKGNGLGSRWRGCVVALAMLAIGMVACRPDRHTMTVNNKSSQTVAWVVVRICGQNLAFTNVPPGASRTTSFAITNDSSYVVTGALANGTPVQGGFDYTTGQWGREKVRVDLLPDGIIAGIQSAAPLWGNR